MRQQMNTIGDKSYIEQLIETLGNRYDCMTVLTDGSIQHPRYYLSGGRGGAETNN
jgi:hypothetical protein